VSKNSKACEMDLSEYLPCDKSITQRVFLYAAMKSGTTHVTGCSSSLGEDSKTMLAAIEKLFNATVQHQEGTITIDSPGLKTLVQHQGEVTIDCRNSGTTLRLLCGLVSSQVGLKVCFIGDSSLSQRPHRRLMDYLAQAGAKFSFANGDGLPLQIEGQKLRWPKEGTKVDLSSAQIKSALIHAALFAEPSASDHLISLPAGSRQHTEKLLSRYVSTEQNENLEILRVSSVSAFEFPDEVNIPKDTSAAAIALTIAMIYDVDVKLQGVGACPSRLKFFEFLKVHGANIDWHSFGDSCEIRVASQSSTLRAMHVKAEESAQMIDELMFLFVLAAVFAKSPCVFYGIKELKYKESNRIDLSVKLLSAVGFKAVYDEASDRLSVDPKLFESFNILTPDDVAAINADHRMLMLALMLRPLSKSLAQIDFQVHNVAISMPGFMSMLQSVQEKSDWNKKE
jgi:3-phosphoshikimate 1-carboxyvinyltransferase